MNNQDKIFVTYHYPRTEGDKEDDCSHSSNKDIPLYSWRSAMYRFGKWLQKVSTPK